MTTKGKGQCLIDSVQMGDATVSVDLTTSQAVLTAKFALVHSESGQRFGFSNKNVGWSEKTQEKLKELIALMEQDVSSSLFSVAGAVSDDTSSSGLELDDYPPGSGRGF